MWVHLMWVHLMWVHLMWGDPRGAGSGTVNLGGTVAVR
jgi:hypothetical protein